MPIGHRSPQGDCQDSQIACQNRRRLLNLSAVLNTLYAWLTGTVRAAVEFSACLNSVTNDAIIAMPAPGSQLIDSAFEAIKHVGFPPPF